jgi:prepilin-type processing-associated H-X9-DG protein
VAADGSTDYSYDGVLNYGFNGYNYPGGVRIEQIKDGTANTIIVGERQPSLDLYWGWWSYPGPDVRTGAVNSYPMYSGQNGYSGTPCPTPAVFGPGSLSNWCAFNSFSSLHTESGANFLFVDGSVHWLTFQVNTLLPGSNKSILQALVTFRGGEVVPSNSY